MIIFKITNMKTTVMGPNVPEQAIRDMMLNGWEVISAHYESSYVCKPGEQCMVCGEFLYGSHHIKMNCCGGRLHSKCALAVPFTECKCAKCSKIFWVQNNDMAVARNTLS